MTKPDNHRIDAPIIFVSPLDKAWDWERVGDEKERVAMAAARRDAEEAGEEHEDPEDPEEDPLPWDSMDDHPVNRYMEGRSRYDVATVREYFLDDVKPVEYRLRRTSLLAWADDGAEAFDAAAR